MLFHLQICMTNHDIDATADVILVILIFDSAKFY